MKNDETVPVSELMRQHGNPFAEVEKVKPAERSRPMGVPLAVALAAWVGASAQQIADIAPGSRVIVIFGGLSALMLIIRWTERP